MPAIEIHWAKARGSPCGGHARRPCALEWKSRTYTEALWKRRACTEALWKSRTCTEALCTRVKELHPPDPEPPQSLASSAWKHAAFPIKFVITSKLPPILLQTLSIYIACQKWQFLCKDEELVALSTQYFLQETSAMDFRGLNSLRHQKLHGISQPGSYYITYNNI